MFSLYGIGRSISALSCPCTASQMINDMSRLFRDSDNCIDGNPMVRSDATKQKTFCLASWRPGMRVTLEDPSQFGPVTAISLSMPSLAGSTESIVISYK